jgi:hypothetical protein
MLVSYSAVPSSFWILFWHCIDLVCVGGMDRNQSLTNVLCGACRDGYIEYGSLCSSKHSSCSFTIHFAHLVLLSFLIQFLSQQIECEETHGGMIFLIVVLIFVMVIILHVLAQTASGLSFPFHLILACLQA